MLETLLGNEMLKESLLAALCAGRLSHSILLCGDAGTGTGYAARCLAADYLYPHGGSGAEQVMHGGCAEVILLAGEGKSGNITVDRVREVRREIFNTAMSANGRVVLIPNAQKLHGGRGDAANALLKVLEEPPDGVLFILTAPSEALILPTLRSRCCSYALAPIAESVCTAELDRLFPKEKNNAEISAVFGGKFGSAKKCLADSAAKAQLADAKLLAGFCAQCDTYAVLHLLSKYEKDREPARILLRLFAQICAASLRGRVGTILPDSKTALRCLPAIGDADAKLAAYVNQKLVLSVLAGTLTAAE
ncbi:MAG: AAA family ATPase [Ruthenibacterium sp.]